MGVPEWYHFEHPIWDPSGVLGGGAPPMEEAVFQICAWGPFAVYIYIQRERERETSGDPCISMHVVMLSPMLEQSQNVKKSFASTNRFCVDLPNGKGLWW